MYGYNVTPLTTRFTSPDGQGLSGVKFIDKDFNTAKVCAKVIYANPNSTLLAFELISYDTV